MNHKSELGENPIEFYWERDWEGEAMEFNGNQVGKIQISLYRDVHYNPKKSILIKDFGEFNIPGEEKHILIVTKTKPKLLPEDNKIFKNTDVEYKNKEYHKDYYQKNKEKIKEYRRKYRNKK